MLCSALHAHIPEVLSDQISVETLCGSQQRSFARSIQSAKPIDVLGDLATVSAIPNKRNVVVPIRSQTVSDNDTSLHEASVASALH